jgi:hypothetical protein
MEQPISHAGIEAGWLVLFKPQHHPDVVDGKRGPELAGKAHAQAAGNFGVGFAERQWANTAATVAFGAFGMDAGERIEAFLHFQQTLMQFFSQGVIADSQQRIDNLIEIRFAPQEVKFHFLLKVKAAEPFKPLALAGQHQQIIGLQPLPLQPGR